MLLVFVLILYGLCYCYLSLYYIVCVTVNCAFVVWFLLLLFVLMLYGLCYCIWFLVPVVLLHSTVVALQLVMLFFSSICC